MEFHASVPRVYRERLRVDVRIESSRPFLTYQVPTHPELLTNSIGYMLIVILDANAAPVRDPCHVSGGTKMLVSSPVINKPSY